MSWQQWFYPAAGAALAGASFALAPETFGGSLALLPAGAAVAGMGAGTGVAAGSLYHDAFQNDQGNYTPMDAGTDAVGGMLGSGIGSLAGRGLGMTVGRLPFMTTAMKAPTDAAFGDLIGGFSNTQRTALGQGVYNVGRALPSFGAAQAGLSAHSQPVMTQPGELTGFGTLGAVGNLAGQVLGYGIPAAAPAPVVPLTPQQSYEKWARNHPAPSTTAPDLMTLMNDPRVTAAVNAQIASMNTPLQHQITDRRTTETQHVNNIAQTQREYARQTHNTQNDVQDTNHNLMAELANNHKQAQGALDQAMANIAGSVSGDTQGQVAANKQGVSTASADSAAAIDKYAAAMGAGTSDAIGQLAQAGQLQAQGSQREEHLAATKDVGDANAQIAANAATAQDSRLKIAQEMATEQLNAQQNALAAWKAQQDARMNQYHEADATAASGGSSTDTVNNYLKWLNASSGQTSKGTDPKSGDAVTNTEHNIDVMLKTPEGRAQLEQMHQQDPRIPSPSMMGWKPPAPAAPKHDHAWWNPGNVFGY